MQWFYWYCLFIVPLVAIALFYYTRSLIVTLFCCISFFGVVRYELLVHNWYSYIQSVHKHRCNATGYIQDIVYCSLPQPSTKIRCVITDPESILYNKTLLVYTKSKVSAYPYDTIVLNNISISKPSSVSFCNYLIKEQVAATIYAPESAITIIPEQSLLGSLATLPSLILYSLQSKMNPQTFNFFCSLFMGKRTPETLETQAYFKKWGISHYIARSGLHLAIVAGFWEFLVRFFPIGWYYRQLLLSYIIFSYFLLTWSSISFIRSISTYFIIKIYAIRKKQYHFLHILSGMMGLFLLYNPLYLFFLDFQLTFLLTGALVWFATISTINTKLLPSKRQFF